MKLFHIDSSILGSHSKSRQLTTAIVARLKKEHPPIEVVYRDLAATPPPHMTLASLPGDCAKAAKPSAGVSRKPEGRSCSRLRSLRRWTDYERRL
jgi:FMN-dependent NADH-azoreductase